MHSSVASFRLSNRAYLPPSRGCPSLTNGLLLVFRREIGWTVQRLPRSSRNSWSWKTRKTRSARSSRNSRSVYRRTLERPYINACVNDAKCREIPDGKAGGRRVFDVPTLALAILIFIRFRAHLCTTEIDWPVVWLLDLFQRVYPTSRSNFNLLSLFPTSM